MNMLAQKIYALLFFGPILALAGHAQNPASPVTRDNGTAAPAGFNLVPTDDIVDFFNARPVSAKAYRILYIGDSLTLHAPSKTLWTYYSGMAASDARHDYVHLSAMHMQTRMPDRPVEIFYCKGNGKLPSMLAYLQAHPEIKPDLIVQQGGENDHFDDAFKTTYRQLLDAFPGTPKIVLSDWGDPVRRDFERAEAAQRKYAFLDLTAIKTQPGTTGNGGPFNVPGVAWHPNDMGMARIAEEIDKAFDSMILRVQQPR